MTATVRTPALYDATVAHERREGIHRSLRHRVYLWLVDLDELPVLPRWLAPFARFDPADHLGAPHRSIRANLDDWLAGQGIDLGGGRVVMLTHARVLGYVFNPLTVYWCHRPGGELACVVAEVHNTYGQRHCYLLTPDSAGHAETPKIFYVSPFFSVDGRYRMRFSQPGPELSVTVALYRSAHPAPPESAGRPDPAESAGRPDPAESAGRPDPPVFTATLHGTRRPATRGQLVRMLLRRPLMPWWIAAAIRGHGIALWARGLPVVARPRHTPAREESA